ncbi:MAG: hypothetical protein IPH09_06125 [bacterium]|nr:hypothetical protein [bacterium]
MKWPLEGRTGSTAVSVHSLATTRSDGTPTPAIATLRLIIGSSGRPLSISQASPGRPSLA